MLSDWQSQTVSEFHAAIEKSESPDQLEPVSMEILLSSQRWIKERCWPVVSRRLAELNVEPSLMMIVDGMNWIRADYSASGSIEDSCQNFMRRLRNFSERFKAKWVVIAADDDSQSRRKDLRHEYKSSRDERPDEVTETARKIRVLCEHSQVPYITAPGWEADDVAATLSTKCIARGHKSIICTNDTDYMQLVNKSCVLFSQSKYINQDAVVEKLGVQPSQVVDFLTLKGKDDIESVHGFGPKTAAELLRKHGDIFGVYDHRHELSEAKRAALESFAPNIWSVRECHRLNRNLMIEFNWEATNCL
jgi:5'-3' exonuclease